MQVFEEELEVRLDLADPALAKAVQETKATIRRKFQALATDATDMIKLSPDIELNAIAIALKDRLDPEGRP